MLDFAGLEAITNVQPWQEIRQEKQADLQRLQLLNAYKDQEVKQQQYAAAQIQDHLNLVGKLQVLDNDKQAIQDKDKELRSGIIGNIQKYNGNAKKYLASGGDVELNNYYNNLANSEEVKRGLKNAYTDSVAKLAQQKGQTLMPVPVNVDGKQQSVPYEQARQMFDQGKIKDLLYNGAYSEPDGGDPRKEFAGVPSPDGNPKQATPTDVYEYYLNKGKGLSEDQRKHFALTRAQQYQEAVKSGSLTPYQYKSTDPSLAKHRETMDKIATAKLALAVRKQENGIGPDPYDYIHGGEHGVPMKQTVNAPAYFTVFGQKPPKGLAPDATQEIQTSIMPLTTQKAKDNEMKDLLGLKYHKSTKSEPWDGWHGKMANGNKALSASNMMPYPGDINDYNYHVEDVSEARTYTSPDGKQKRPYASITVKFKDNGDLKEYGAAAGIWPFRHENAASQGDIDLDKHTLKLLVPVDPEPLSVRQFKHSWNGDFKQKDALSEDSYFNDDEN